MPKKTRGSLIIIGGHESKDTRDEAAILNELARRAKNKALVVVTDATMHPKEAAATYRKVFQALNVKDVRILDIRVRDEAYDDDRVNLLNGAGVVFFTGGDQLRLTSQLADSPVFRRIEQLFAEEGATIAGTSAGAAAMPETMIASGRGETSITLDEISMASGLGFMEDVVIDSHFAERGRIGRLIVTVAQNPRNLGIGIDENTAVVTDGKSELHVIGGGAVYILDGSRITYSSLSEESPEGIMSVFNITLHVLRAGDRFDLKKREPSTAALNTRGE